jgi:hypothetical protein
MILQKEIIMLDYPSNIQGVSQEIFTKLMMSQYESVKDIINHVKPKPITEEKILDLISELSKLDGEFTFESFWLKYARLIEKAHGID